MISEICLDMCVYSCIATHLLILDAICGKSHKVVRYISQLSLIKWRHVDLWDIAFVYFLHLGYGDRD